MNLFGCLFPCVLQQSWWGGGGGGGPGGGSGGPGNGSSSDDADDQCMSDDEFVRRMGVNASTVTTGEPTGNNMSTEPPMPGYRDTMGVIIRERKKKVTGFATLKKKFIRRRRSSKACDHGRVLRELVANWTPLELNALLEEYEALAALKDLCVQAELARPPAATFKQDLSALYDFKYCTDADLVYRGACFPVHRALLSARCPYFRDLLAGCPGYGARICLELRTATVDVQLFSALLRYLYTGDICPHDTNVDVTVLRHLREEFGAPNPLEHDLRYLLESGDYADAALVFTSDGGGGCPLGSGGGAHGGNGNNLISNLATGSSGNTNQADCIPSHHHQHQHHHQQQQQQQRPDSGSGGSGSSAGSEYGFRPKLELPCHKAILSARSHFFRNLLQRRCRSGEEHTERALHIPTRIVLDENVIPKRYAKVLLHAVYLDHVDLSLIARGGYSGGGLGEAQALAHTGRARPTALEEAMELYQIGRFLELDILSQGCEDLILECLGVDTLPAVLQWARQPYGSAWVHRQAIHFLREEFQPIAQSVVLHQLDKLHLSEVLKSPFLQASEQEILHAVLKWGENELVRRMEDREPNLLCHTAHSVARKGVKKRDLSDTELRDILADLLPLVRTEHVLPSGCDILQQTLRRGLLSQPPSCMLGGDVGGGGATGGGGPTVRGGGGAGGGGAQAWVRGKGGGGCVGAVGGVYQQPRLFMPYYEELKVLLEDQVVHEVDLMRLRRSANNNNNNNNNSSGANNTSNRYATTQLLSAHHPDNIPDTLYMVANEQPPMGHNGGGGHGLGHHHHHHHHHGHGGSGHGHGHGGGHHGIHGGNTDYGITPSNYTNTTGASNALPQSHYAHHQHHNPPTNAHQPSPQLHPTYTPTPLTGSTQPPTTTIYRPDVLASQILPVPDPALLAHMLRRERKLRAAPGCQRSLAQPLAARAEILRQIRLRVVREFNMPDAVAEMLEQHCYCAMMEGGSGGGDVEGAGGEGVEGGVVQQAGQHRIMASHRGGNMTFPRPLATTTSNTSTSALDLRSNTNLYASHTNTPPSTTNQYLLHHGRHTHIGPTTIAHSHHTGGPHSTVNHHHHHHHHAVVGGGGVDLPALVVDGRDAVAGRYAGVGGGAGYMAVLDHGLEGGLCGESGHLSDIMPDVAMATAGLGQMHLQEGSSTSSSAVTLLALQQQQQQQQQLQPLLPIQQQLHQQQQQEMELDLGDGAAHLLHGGGSGLMATPHQAMTMQHPLTLGAASSNNNTSTSTPSSTFQRRYARSDGAVSPANTSALGAVSYHPASLSGGGGPASITQQQQQQQQLQHHSHHHHLPPPSPSSSALHHHHHHHHHSHQQQQQQQQQQLAANGSSRPESQQSYHGGSVSGGGGTSGGGSAAQTTALLPPRFL